MPAGLKERILAYCNANSIVVPPGFGRNTPSRYVVVRIDAQPAKLVAMTWSKVTDVIYYLDNLLKSQMDENLGKCVRIFDFKEGEELELRGSKQLQSKGKIE
jgi:hypothetical protein